MTDLAKFITIEMQERGWSMRGLAKRAGISHSQISNVVSGKVQPGNEFCFAIARALNKQPAAIMRLAGILPPSRDELRAADPIYDESCTILERLNDTLRLSALAMLRGLANATGFAPPQTALPEMSPGYLSRPAVSAPTPTGRIPNDGGKPGTEIEQKFYELLEDLSNQENPHRLLFDAIWDVASDEEKVIVGRIFSAAAERYKQRGEEAEKKENETHAGATT